MGIVDLQLLEVQDKYTALLKEHIEMLETLKKLIVDTTSFEVRFAKQEAISEKLNMQLDVLQLNDANQKAEIQELKNIVDKQETQLAAQDLILRERGWKQ